MNRDSQKGFEQAKRYAFLLLKFRMRSNQELILRLKKKGFSEQVINDTVSFLKEKKFIDDVYFARCLINSRLKRPFGVRRIKQELKQKGVNKEIAEAQLQEAQKDYCEGKIIKELASQRLAKLKNIEPYAAKRRVYAYLLRRGFSPDTVTEILNQLCKQIY